MATGFQELAMDASTAKLMNFGARVLYLGPAFGLTPHRNATAVLAVALDGAIDVADDPGCSDSSYRTARSVLILPNSLHHLRIDGGRMAFLYVDPFGRDLAALRTRMREAGARADFDLVDEEKAIDLLKAIADARHDARSCAPRGQRTVRCGIAGQGRCPDRRSDQMHARCARPGASAR